MVSPLKKRKLTGTLYTRVDKITTLLTELEALPRAELVERCKIKNRSDPGYVPSECLLYFVRACRAEPSERHFASIYEELTKRVLNALPRAEFKTSDGKMIQAFTVAGLTRSIAFEEFQEMLVEDRDPETYSYTLDFYEVRFDSALKALKTDAQRKAYTQMKYQNSEFSEELDQKLGLADRSTEQRLEDEDFQSALANAIVRLPSDERKIITMLLEGIPIDSKNPDQPTIAKALDKSEKTIRTYRDRAIAALRQMLNPEAEQ